MAVLVGHDINRQEIFVGDMCKFNIQLSDGLKSMCGIVVYDEDSFAYAFETIDVNAPLLCMYAVEINSIEKLYTPTYEKLKDNPMWLEIYINSTK